MDWTKGFQFIPSDRDGLWLEERVEDLRQEKTVTSPQRVSYYITIVLWHGLRLCTLQLKLLQNSSLM